MSKPETSLFQTAFNIYMEENYPEYIAEIRCTPSLVVCDIKERSLPQHLSKEKRQMLAAKEKRQILADGPLTLLDWDEFTGQVDRAIKSMKLHREKMDYILGIVDKSWAKH